MSLRKRPLPPSSWPMKWTCAECSRQNLTVHAEDSSRAIGCQWCERVRCWLCAVGHALRGEACLRAAGAPPRAA